VCHRCHHSLSNSGSVAFTAACPKSDQINPDRERLISVPTLNLAKASVLAPHPTTSAQCPREFCAPSSLRGLGFLCELGGCHGRRIRQISPGNCSNCSLAVPSCSHSVPGRRRHFFLPPRHPAHVHCIPLQQTRSGYFSLRVKLKLSPGLPTPIMMSGVLASPKSQGSHSYLL